jgi:hypothetical protein
MSKIYSAKEFREIIAEALLAGEADEQTHDDGEIVIYTGMYEWSDLTIRDYAEPKLPN